MNELEVKENEKIKDLIYKIRGVQVILDSDLAKLYECVNGTKDINKAVKRNMERFPTNFMFQLTDEEYDTLRFQSGTSKIRGGRRYNPYAFTEQGVAMLSSVLHTEIAIKMSIQIINTFVIMRKYISNNLIEQRYINNLVLEHDTEIKLLKESFGKIEEQKKVNEIYFNGQIYDAYSKIQEIFHEAKKEITIIDAYADFTLLDIIKRLNINITIIKSDNFHDRFIIIDNKILYHSGASFKI